jgi:hypothetical protein
MEDALEGRLIGVEGVEGTGSPSTVLSNREKVSTRAEPGPSIEARRRLGQRREEGQDGERDRKCLIESLRGWAPLNAS